MLVAMLSCGRVRRIHRIMPMTYLSTPIMSIHQLAVVATSVAPSAASTQVVPNGGKRKETRLGTDLRFLFTNVSETRRA